MKNKKYAKDGISLNFLGEDTLTTLVKEIISEAISKLENIDEDLSGIKETIDFLKLNFDIPQEEKE